MIGEFASHCLIASRKRPQEIPALEYVWRDWKPADSADVFVTAPGTGEEAKTEAPLKY